MESRVDYLTDIYYNESNIFQEEFNKAINGSIQKAVQIFEGVIKTEIGKFQKEMENFFLNISVPTTLSKVMSGISEIVNVLLLNMILPGGYVNALVGRVVLYILEKIPIIGKFASPLSKIIKELINNIGKVVAKSYVKNQIIIKGIEDAKAALDDELQEQCELIFKEMKSKIEMPIINTLNNYKKNLENLYDEKRKRKHEFYEHIESVKKLLVETETLCNSITRLDINMETLLISILTLLIILILYFILKKQIGIEELTRRIEERDLEINRLKKI